MLCISIFLGEHFKAAGGALVVPGAVVGNHCSRGSAKDLSISRDLQSKKVGKYWSRPTKVI